MTTSDKRKPTDKEAAPAATDPSPAKGDPTGTTLPDDALPTVHPDNDAAEADRARRAALTDEGSPRPPLADGTDLSADDRISRLENDVSELRDALLARDSEHFGHHTRLAASGYGPSE